MMVMLLGLSIGLYAIEPASEENPFGGLATGSTLWWILSWLVALFLGGWVTSRFAGLQRKFDGALHGIVTWALTFLVSLLLLTNAAGMILGGTFGVMRTVFSAAGQTVSAVAPQVSEMLTGIQDPIQSITQEAKQVIEAIRQRGGERAVAELTDAIKQIFAQPEITQADRQRIVGILLQYTDMSEQQARSTVDQWVTSYQQLRQSVQKQSERLAQTAEKYSDALGTAALASFFTLLLGAAAAALGGMAGRVKGLVKVE
jgi:CHASE3 domain sensor protein